VHKVGAGRETPLAGDPLAGPRASSGSPAHAVGIASGVSIPAPRRWGFSSPHASFEAAPKAHWFSFSSCPDSPPPKVGGSLASRGPANFSYRATCPSPSFTLIRLRAESWVPNLGWALDFPEQFRRPARKKPGPCLGSRPATKPGRDSPAVNGSFVGVEVFSLLAAVSFYWAHALLERFFPTRTTPFSTR
jgi:hypothetical protein